jgi:hypothetical protein
MQTAGVAYKPRPDSTVPEILDKFAAGPTTTHYKSTRTATARFSCGGSPRRGATRRARRSLTSRATSPSRTYVKFPARPTTLLMLSFPFKRAYRVVLYACFCCSVLFRPPSRGLEHCRRRSPRLADSIRRAVPATRRSSRSRLSSSTGVTMLPGHPRLSSRKA